MLPSSRKIYKFRSVVFPRIPSQPIFRGEKWQQYGNGRHVTALANGGGVMIAFIIGAVFGAMLMFVGCGFFIDNFLLPHARRSARYLELIVRERDGGEL